MFFSCDGRPALMFPGQAYLVESPGAGWSEVDYHAVEVSGEPLDQDAFWHRFENWKLGTFPVAFALLERRPRYVPHPRPRWLGLI